ncbi:TolC family protein [Niveibacterium microcysteis]|uniref:TolC family protein n=1 Tax=Niveibacterium microcysteis TaxID=2811415 RepID=A0ABX7M8W6_9RHOO|nr:TolC family protein [Niveibacterium microcysteis]QSI78185.1 TolC family protein [Niveibacterium microcysteis]
MRFKILVAATMWAATNGTSFAQSTEPQAARALTLEEAWRQAEQANPALRRKAAQQAALEGAAQDASALFFNNPQINWEGTRREVPQPGLPDERRKEWSAGLSQTLEIGGQRGYRVSASEAAMAAQAAELESLRRELQVLVAQQAYRVQALQQRVGVEEAALILFEQTATAVAKRRAAGEDTKLDANVAVVEAERAHSQLEATREQLIDARNELAATLQWPAGTQPEVSADLADGLEQPLPALAPLLSALPTQPRVRALAAQEESARSRLGLERASRIPDVTLGLSVGREGAVDARERLTTLSLSVPLPLFKRNASGVGEASAALTQAQIERESSLRDGEANVRSLHARLQSLQRRVQRLQSVVAPTLGSNAQLSEKSRRAGQIGLLEHIVVSRQALDARRDLIDSQLDFQNTRLALMHAAGRPLAPEQGKQP